MCRIKLLKIDFLFIHNINKMEKLNKDELFTLAIYLDLRSLLNFCQGNKYFHNSVYKRDEIWIYRLNKDFPDFQKLGVGKSFNETYKILFSLSKLKEKLKRSLNIYDLYSVEWMDLSDMNLTEVPKEIENLTSLKTLYLFKNKLMKVPKEIENLTSLKTLSLRDNKLTEIPQQIYNLINLEVLYLHNNKLTEIPKEIYNLINLRELYLCNNKLTEVDKEIGNLTNLKILNLYNDKLVEIPKEIGKLPNLKNLHLSKSTKIPKEIIENKNIRIIN